MDSVTLGHFSSMNKSIIHISSFNSAGNGRNFKIEGEGISESIIGNHPSDRSLVIHGALSFSDPYAEKEAIISEVKLRVQDLMIGRHSEYLLISNGLDINELQVLTKTINFFVLKILTGLNEQDERDYFSLKKVIENGGRLDEYQQERHSQLYFKIEDFIRQKEEIYKSVLNQNKDVGGTFELF